LATAVTVGATNNPEIDGLLGGSRWSGSITYSFPDSPSDYPYFGYSQDNEPAQQGFASAPAAMQAAINYAINLIKGYTNISISYAGTNTADIQIAQSPAANPTSYAYYPGNYAAGGDIWFGTKYDYSAAALGNYFFATALHELGHALGLKHSQEAGGVANVAVPTAHDDSEYTIMSYRSYVGAPLTGYTAEQYGFSQTYMANDILALQTLYGANYNTQSGNTVYSWSPTTGQMFINGVGQLPPGGGTGGAANRIFETIWDGGGVDTYDLSNYSTSVSINLNPGAWTVTSQAQLAYLGNGHYAAGNILNAYLFNNNQQSLIDNAIGGSGNDIIIGNAIANVLNGGAGNDTITGGGGNDTIIGGPGIDTAVYSGNKANYLITYNSATQTFTIADQRNGSPDGTDTVTEVENFQFADGTFASSSFMPVNHAPVATAPNVTLAKGNTNPAASSLFTVSDADGDSITQYQFWDSSSEAASGHFVVAGVAQGTNQAITVSASQLAQTTFQAGSITDHLWVRAFDGRDWGAWAEFYLTPWKNSAPVVTAPNVTLAKGNTNPAASGLLTVAASSLFTVNDADGDSITQYQFWDSSPEAASGHFVVGGVAQGTNQAITVSVSQLAQTTFQAGSIADHLWVRAFDGTDWGAWAEFYLTPPQNKAPVATAPSVTLAKGNTNPAASSLFTVSDADGDSITQYQFWDSSPEAASGHFVVGGVAQGTNQAITVSASQLAQTTFQVGSITDHLWVRAFDGTDWGAWAEFYLTPWKNSAPVATAPNVTLAKGNTNPAASSLFTVSDADGDSVTQYQFWDSSSEAASGHFVVGGVAQGTNQAITVSASQLAQTTFQAGSITDHLWVRAFDGTDWGAWKEFYLTPWKNSAPVATAPNVTLAKGSTNPAASSLFTVSDADGDSVTQYQFWDSSPEAASGHFVVGGVAQGTNQAITVSASQLAQTTFQAGSITDHLWVRAFDGTDWGTWTEFYLTPWKNSAPVATAPNVTLARGSNPAASSLFTVSDADGDSVTQYQFWDSSPEAASGHFVVGGVAQGTNQAITVSASQLAQTTFQVGSITDHLWVRAFDGTDWGAWTEFYLTPSQNSAPLASDGLEVAGEPDPFPMWTPDDAILGRVPAARTDAFLFASAVGPQMNSAKELVQEMLDRKLAPATEFHWSMDTTGFAGSAGSVDQHQLSLDAVHSLLWMRDFHLA